MQRYLIVVCGPTGIGKTDVSVHLARTLNSVIISSDSRQIYREMTIGTAVPSPDELNAVPHYFIHSHTIHDGYSASLFESEVIEFLSRHFVNNRLAFMSGGSGLYISAVCNGIDDIPTVSPETRKKWLQIYNEKGLEFLQMQVKTKDPDYFKTVDRNNPKRLLKALEVSEISGRPYSSFLKKEKKKRPFHCIKVGLNTARDLLYESINMRVDKMMQAGLEAEARKLYAWKHLTPLNTVGYKELFQYFDGRISLEEAVERIKNHSRAYARRQITWFRRDESIRWFEPEQKREILEFIERKIR